jgi:diphthamide synthase (EF-2-diphthine--ammonia ligase)
MSFVLMMKNLKYERNHSHGNKLKILELHADALGIPLLLVDSAGDYEKSLVNALRHLKDSWVSSKSLSSVCMLKKTVNGRKKCQMKQG